MRALLGALAAGVVLALGGPAFAADQAQVQHGHDVFQYWCSACHAGGPGHPGTDALAVKYKDGSRPILLEQRTDLTPAQVRYYVRHGVSIMPFFRKTEISDPDLDALGAYLARERR